MACATQFVFSAFAAGDSTFTALSQAHEQMQALIASVKRPVSVPSSSSSASSLPPLPMRELDRSALSSSSASSTATSSSHQPNDYNLTTHMSRWMKLGEQLKGTVD